MDIAEEIRRVAMLAAGRPSSLGFGPVDPERIQVAETDLGVRLPKSYCAYLARFAGGMLLGYEMSGIPTGKSVLPLIPQFEGDAKTTNLIYDVVALTGDYRGSMPPGYVHLCGDGGDYTFFLDTASTVGDECPVVMWGPGAHGLVVASSFLEFVRLIASGASFGG